MAKQLQNLALFVPGVPGSSDPTNAFMTYDVVDGTLKKKNNTHEVASPDWSKTALQFWTDEVAVIKSNEGIA